VLDGPRARAVAASGAFGEISRGPNLRPVFEAVEDGEGVSRIPPSVYGIDYELVPDHPVEGTVVTSLHYLLGGTYQATDPRGRKVAIPRHHLDWLRGHEPVLRLGSIWVFDVKTKAGDDPGRMRGDDRLPRSSQGNGEQR
jgi:hypothetical protein